MHIEMCWWLGLPSKREKEKALLFPAIDYDTAFPSVHDLKAMTSCYMNCLESLPIQIIRAILTSLTARQSIKK